MGKSDKTCLTGADQTFIKEHANDYTPSELAKLLKKPYCNVYNYLIRHKIVFLSERAKREAKNPPPPLGKKGMFDVFDHDGNWII